MRRRVVVSLIMIAALLSLGGGVLALLVSSKPQAVSSIHERGPLAVEVVRVAAQDLVEPIIAYGTARAEHFAWIAAQVPGQIVERLESLKVGRSVRKGEVLIRIDEREHQQRLKRAQSALRADTAALEQLDIEAANLTRLIDIARSEAQAAEREHARVRDLVERGVSGPREYDQALAAHERSRRVLAELENQEAVLPKRRERQEAACALRQAELEISRLNVQRCSVAAAFDGRIEQVRVESGEHVGTGDPLFSLLDPRRIEVPVELPVSLRERVAVGAACTLTLDSAPGRSWSGKVDRIAAVASERSRMFQAFVEIDNAAQEQQLMPGMFVRAEIAGPKWTNVIVIPRAAIHDQRVFVVSDGRARLRSVRVRRRLLDLSIVVGLRDGDLVITSNFDALSDGAPVRAEIDLGTSAATAAAPPTDKQPDRRP